MGVHCKTQERWLNTGAREVLVGSVFYLRFCILCDKLLIMDTMGRGGIRGTVVELWTAGQQVEQSILHQGHDS